MSFWDIVWFIIIAYAFMTYLMVLFSVIGDLFRDRSSSGVTKAVWIFALIFVPFVAALVYLIAKGDDMATRSASSRDELRAQQDAYIRETAGTTTPADQITQARALLSRGEISEAEFTTLKAKALA